MQVGRNDPCPCGSGKKYKKCCMEKDLAAERAGKVVGSKPLKLRQKTWADFEHLKINDFIDDDEFDEDEDEEEEEEEKFIDPRQINLFGEDEFPTHSGQNVITLEEAIQSKAARKRWEEFDAADYEDKIFIFTKTLQEKTLMDDEMAFEMLAEIHSEVTERDETDRVLKLIQQLKKQMPLVYEGHAIFYLDWMIDFAVKEARHDDIVSLLKEMALKANQNIDIFNYAFDRLAYHGYQAPLLETMKAAWTNVENSSDIVTWGIDEFAEKGIDYAAFDYVENHSEINPNDPDLIKTVRKFYHELDMKEFTKYVNYVSGKEMGEWILEDFDPKSKHRKLFPKNHPKKSAENNIYYLSVEFLNYLRTEEHVPFSKGHLAQLELLNYFDKRNRRELVEEPGLLEKLASPGKHKPKKQALPKHILCPDASTLDVFLGGLLNFINPQHYKLAATIELIPAWLKFLEARQLIDKNLHDQTLNSIRKKIIKTLLNVYDRAVSDPSLKQNLVRIWQV